MSRALLSALLLFVVGVALRIASDPARGDTVRPPGSAAPQLPRAMPPLRYRITATVAAPSGRIDGRMDLELRNTSNTPLHELRFHLYLNAYASPDTLFMRSSGGRHRGNKAGERGWIRVSSVSAAGRALYLGAHEDGTVGVLPLTSPLAPGATLRLQLAYTAQLPSLFARTGKSGELLMVAQWYPKLAFLRPDGSWHCPPFHANSEFFAQFGDYDVTVDLPPSYVLGATGQRVSSPRDAPAGRHRFIGRWIHDFAFVAWPHFHRVQQQIEGVDVELLTVAGRDPRRQLELVRYGLRRLNALLFRYPYSRLTVVDLPRAARGAAAMEYPTLLTTGAPRWTPSGIHHGDEVTVHELTHQFLYGVVATNEVQEPWLDEGLTTYLSGALLDELFGPQTSLLRFGPLRLGQLGKNRLHALSAAPAPLSRPARDFSGWESYAANVYGRTASLLYTLESLLGRQRLRAALRSFATHGRFGHPSGSALRQRLLAEAQPGARPHVAALLDGVLDRGLTLDAGLRCSADEIVVERRGTLALPLVLRWRDDGGHERVRLLGPRERATLRTPRLREARLGPYRRLALDVSPEDDRCVATDARWASAWRYLPTLRQLLALVGP